VVLKDSLHFYELVKLRQNGNNVESSDR